MKFLICSLAICFIVYSPTLGINIFDPATLWYPVDVSNDEILPRVLNFTTFEINGDLNRHFLLAVAKVEEAQRMRTFSLRNFLPLNHRMKIVLKETTCVKEEMLKQGFDFKSCPFSTNSSQPGLECNVEVRYTPPFDPKLDKPRYELLKKECAER